MKTCLNLLSVAVIVILILMAQSGYAAQPKVIKTIPENGTQDVDPALKLIRIEFDQDMATSGYSICGGGPKFPELLGKPRWLNKRTLVAGVKLEPNHEYEMSINCPSYQNCKNTQSEPAEIYPVSFKTATATKEPNAASKSPAILLQEGFYAEETEGNLDKAMEIYSQIRQKYNDVERISARATYQLGLCYLKKGDNKKATQLFQEVVEYYPQQTEVVKMAQQQLDKLGVKKTAEESPTGKKIEPLKLEPAPWVDGEVMELRLKHPTGNEYGTIIYSAQSNKNHWQIISHMYVSEGAISQYTYVEAEAESFAPIYGQTTNWMGNFKAEYGKGNVKLTVDAGNNKSTKAVPVDGVAYDNEQAIYLIRRMPLAEGYEDSFQIFTVQAGVTVECRIKVSAVEDVNVEAGTFKCYKTELSINSQGVKTLQHTLWFLADEHKYLVKYDVGGTAAMEMAKTWQRDKDKPITFENTEPAFAVAIPAAWRFYKYGFGPQSILQLIPPEIKAWALLAWQKRGTDPNSASAMTIAKADCEKLRGFFENYTADQNSFKELQINSLQAVQYPATYQESGNRLQKYNKPKEMVEYRTYIVDASNVYWFVFRVEKENFEKNKAEFDSIIQSFKLNAK